MSGSRLAAVGVAVVIVAALVGTWLATSAGGEAADPRVVAPTRFERPETHEPVVPDDAPTALVPDDAAPELEEDDVVEAITLEEFLRLAAEQTAYVIRGRVVDEADAPVADVALRARRLGAAAEAGGVGVSAENGAFAIGIADAGDYLLTVRAPGYVSRGPVVARVDEIAPEAEVVVPLVGESFIEGIVVRVDGAPIDGVLLAAAGRRPGDPSLPTSSFEVRLLPYLRPWSETDETGTFRIESLHPEKVYRVRCTIDDQTVAELDTVAPGASVRIVVPDEALDGMTLRGVVVDAGTGQPVTRYRISVEGALGSTGGARNVDDPDGAFSVDGLRAGQPYVLRVDADGYGAHREALGRLEPDTPPLRVELGTRGVVRVLVRLPDGAPADGVRVHLTPRRPEDSAFGALGLFTDLYGDTTGADGAAVLDSVAPGAWYASAQGFGLAAPSVGVNVRSGTETSCELWLAPALDPGRLTVRVLDAGGRPVVGAVVAVMRPGGAADETGLEPTLTDEDGLAVYADLDPAMYLVLAVHEESFVVPMTVILTSGSDTTVEARLP